ncbi:RNA-binding protein 39-like isoform X2 [Watersipora subatra]|uniref:RNA-binding protein 39-like isoform X2 n=1 Tax=Watersipora subatra TaxID=2589382 RepID=UPI00355BDD48
MADDLDVEAMLEAPYREKENKDSNHKSDRRRRSRSRDRGSNRRDDRDRRDRDRRRSRSRDRRDRDRKRSRSRERKRRSRSRERESKRKSPLRRGQSPPSRKKERSPPLTPEERDARTVFCMQLAARIRSRDLEEFFSSVGKVKDVKLITDNKTRRSKGIAYVEFVDVASVSLAMGLNGQKLLGVPILVQQSQAEKNRAAGQATMNLLRGQNTGPMRLYVGSLHFNITDDMLRGIFEPFGRIEHINLVLDPETQKSKGFGFVTFKNADDAVKAMNQLNGFELAGRPMKVGHVTEKQEGLVTQDRYDNEELERHGYDLGATGRIALMAKLAEGTGFNLPAAAQNALDLQMSTQIPALNQSQPPIATQCFMLSNMFDPNSEANQSFDVEIRDDVIEECNKHGGVLHIYVDKSSAQGNVYVKCPSIASAVASVNALHGRWFAGKMITAAYVPLPNYHQLFPDAAKSTQLLMPSSRAGLM